MYVVIVGSLVGGITEVFGPFADHGDAHVHSEVLYNAGEDAGVHVIEVTQP